MSDHSFGDLLLKYQAGTATKSEREAVELWYALLEQTPGPMANEELEEIENRIWSTVAIETSNSNLIDKKLHASPGFRNTFRWAAAMLVLAGTIAALFFIPFSRPEETASSTAIPGFRTVRNVERKPLELVLDDGSRVSLRTGSSIAYPEHFSGPSRDVLLTGTAFFEIKKDPKRPFFVRTGNLVTKVLGTSFFVKSNADASEVEVSVKTGRVSVFEKGNERIENFPDSKTSGVVITRNQQVKFRAQKNSFELGLVDNPEISSDINRTAPSNFKFHDTPISNVLRNLSEAYNIEIRVDDEVLGNCPLTADLSEKNLFVQLELISAAIQGSYHINGTVITITGKNCD